MKKLIKAIEKMKPFFDAVARNDLFPVCQSLFSQVFSYLWPMYQIFLDSIGQQISKQSL